MPMLTTSACFGVAFLTSDDFDATLLVRLVLVFSALDAVDFTTLVLLFRFVGVTALFVFFVVVFCAAPLFVRAVVLLAAVRVVLGFVRVRGVVFDCVVFVERFDVVRAAVLVGARAVVVFRDFVSFVLF